jgi:hypothetical protein
MAVVRVEALRALAAAIETAVPALAGKVKVGQQPSNVEQTYPTLTLVPARWKFEPHQESVHATIGDAADGNVVFNVGAHAGIVQLRIVATTPGERYELEQRVIDVLLGQEGRPGVFVVPVTAIASLSSWIAAFEYEADSWNDGFAFDRKLESLIELNAIVPALVARTGVYEIDELVLGLEIAADLDALPDLPPDTEISDVAGVEVVVIDEDGNLSPYVPPP